MDLLQHLSNNRPFMLVFPHLITKHRHQIPLHLWKRSQVSKFLVIVFQIVHYKQDIARSIESYIPGAQAGNPNFIRPRTNRSILMLPTSPVPGHPVSFHKAATSEVRLSFSLCWLVRAIYILGRLIDDVEVLVSRLICVVESGLLPTTHRSQPHLKVA